MHQPVLKVFKFHFTEVAHNNIQNYDRHDQTTDIKTPLDLEYRKRGS